MKTTNSLKTISLAVIASLGLMLSACNKNNNNNGLVSGSLRSDGNTVTSQGSTIQGAALNLTISNVTTGYTNNTLAYNNPYMNNMGGSALSFDMNINGMAQRVSVSTQWTDFVQLGNGYYYQGAYQCLDASCVTVLVAVVVTPSFYEFKEIAFKKNMQQNKVIAIKELQGAYQNLHSLSQLAYEF